MANVFDFYLASQIINTNKLLNFLPQINWQASLRTYQVL